MKPLFTIIILLASFYNQAQTRRLDSLKSISKKQTGIVLVKTLNEISWEFRNSQADSALVYAWRAYDVAERLKDEQAIASAYNNIASSYEFLQEIDSAVFYHQKSLKINLSINNAVGTADTYNNLGIIEDNQGNYASALTHYFKALKIYEAQSKNFEKPTTVLINIGIVYKKQKEYKKALNYYQKALKIYKKNHFEIGETIVTGNIGSLLINLEDYEKSIQYSEKAKRLYAKMGYSRYIPYMLGNIGIAKDSLKQYDAARKDYLEAIPLFQSDANLYELSNTKISLANNYMLKNEFQPAKKELVEALKLIDSNGFKEMKVKALKKLYKLYWKTNDLKNAFITQEAYIVAKDSLFESEKVKTIYELETKYETEKKEKEILSQRANIAEKELRLTQKNTQIIGLGILALVVAALGYLLFNQQKLKNSQLQKENELKEALIKIESQNKLQEQRLNISRDLHDNIGAQLTFIISSIDNLQYGFKINDTKLTNKLSGISTFTKETIYELRDTIWAMNKNDISLEDLQVRISNFIDKGQIATSGIKFSFNRDADLSNSLKFTSVEGMNIYRIVQEAINNAMKYANAKTIVVNFMKAENNIKIAVIDDGIGFDMNKIEYGNGLNNMKKRANEINAILDIKSEITVGTKVLLKITN